MTNISPLPKPHRRMTNDQLLGTDADAPRGWRFSLRTLLVGVTLLAIALALITPAVFAAREAAHRMSASNNAKNIVLAMHNYHEQNRMFPYGVVHGTDGKPMCGWRFALTPFIESSPFFNQYNQRLAWDHPTNLAMEQFTYPLYSRPGQRNKVPHATNFVVISGPGTLFPDDGQRTLSDIADGASNTIVVVEIGSSDIPWYEPRDLRIDTMSFRINDPDRSKPCIGSRLGRGAIVGFADGHVELLPEDTPPEKLRAMLTIAGD
jgi:prepilin-type processing-associated H-X9-DG protein